MTVFTGNELDTLQKQRLGRLATVDARGNPEADTLDIGGHGIARSKKWRSIAIEADAELLESGGEQLGPGFAPEIIRLHPVEIIAWGLDPQRQSRIVKDSLYP